MTNTDTQNYNDLKEQLQSEGCFESATMAYVIRISLIVATYFAAYVVLLSDPTMMVRIGALLVAAFVTVQAGFISHDAGDGAVTRNRGFATALRQLFLSFSAGVSSTYFNVLHRVHHKTMMKGSTPASDETPTNEYEGLALKKLVSKNGLLFVITMVCLRAFTFKFESVRYMMRHIKTTGADQWLVALHAVFWLVVPIALIGVDALINYGLMTLFIGPYIGTVLIINHAGMSTARTQSHLPRFARVTATTRNLGQSIWDNIFFGGVNNHIEHHLFPGIPVPRLSKARKITSEFCRDRKLPYVETTYTSALGEALAHFSGLTPNMRVSEALN